MSQPLHRAVFSNDIPTLKKLLASPSTNSCTSSNPDLDKLYRGQTPLTLAISLGHSEAVTLLLEAGASTLVRNGEGWTAFQEATSYGDRETMEAVYRARRRELATWVKTVGKQVLNGLAEELQDFYVEMRWSFGSYVPFVSTLCPSDTYKVFKKGRSIRIDTTLVGFESLSWVRGDVSLIFTDEDGKGSRLVVCDHQRRLVQQLWPRDFTIGDQEVQEELSVSLNTKMVTPPQFDFSSFSSSRTQSGFWAFKVDRSERVGPWDTRVWSIDTLECTTKIRREHLEANPPPPVREEDKKAEESDESKSDVEELDEDELIRRYDAGEWNRVERKERERGRKAFRELAKFRPTLDKPIRGEDNPAVTADEYFAPESAGSLCHLGRPIIEERETKSYKATLWMFDETAPNPTSSEQAVNAESQVQVDELITATSDADDSGQAYTYFPAIVQATPTPPPSIRSDKFPLRFETVRPLIDLIGLDAPGHVQSLKEFFNVQMPPGFPGLDSFTESIITLHSANANTLAPSVQIEIPVGLLPLSARLTFQNISTTYVIDDSMFAIPGRKQGYRAGEVVDGSDGGL
ncbi:hypothetical protein HKX48_001298 [Thoreauomyces humboldtii]|nr:hypothetical protein HKX48_001298 [Thoreauomyces humboldtii]